METHPGEVALGKEPLRSCKDARSCLITDLPAWLNSYARLKEKVKGNLAMLFPGHDQDLLLNYPKGAEDVTPLV